MKRLFHDVYGCGASLTVHRDRTATLIIRTQRGALILRRTYGSERGARIAMGMYSDSWTELTGRRQ